MKLRTLFIAGISALVAAVLAAQAQVPGVNSTLNSVFTLAYDNSTMKPTYSASYAFSPTATSASDICNLTGSATKTIKVRRIFFNAQATTAVTVPVAIIKRSTANTGGTGNVATAVPYDSSNSAATAVATMYTANPTTGTIVGVLADPYFSIGNLTTGGAAPFPSNLTFGQLGSPIVLRGVAQSVSISLNSGSYSGIVSSCGFEWTEE